MSDIICPHCNKVFKVDKKGYADILKQVYNKEFDDKLSERLTQFEKDKSMEINFKTKEIQQKLREVEVEKDKAIDELKFSLREAANVKKLEIAAAVKGIEKELSLIHI